MKRISLIAALLILVLSACSSGIYEVAYTARGDGTNIVGLNQTNQFQRTDDINIVVKVNSHDDPITVSASFFKPDGTQEGETLESRLESGTGSVALGLDFESRPSGEDWETGSWRVQIRIDGELVDEKIFRVN